MRLTYSGCSRRGLVRSTNEDAYLMCATDYAGLFLVADGIGGKEHGEVVSGMLRNSYDRWWRERVLVTSKEFCFQSALSEIKEVLLKINHEVVNRFGELSAGSTLVLMFVFQGHCLLLSSGDSRIYRSHGLSFKQLTTDDVYENSLGRDKKLDASSVGKLVGAVGIRSTPEFSVSTIPWRSGDRFFLCSDGIYRYITARKLQTRVLLDSSNPPKLIDSISRIVEANGAGDNYSMICVKVSSV